MEIQMFLKKKNQSRKRLLQDMDGELDMAQALGLCAVAMKRPRKGRNVDEDRSSSWWRNGYQNWDDTAFKKSFAYKSSNVSVHSWRDRGINASQ